MTKYVLAVGSHHPDWDDLKYRAEMTQRQFSALRKKTEPAVSPVEIQDCQRFRKPKKTDTVDLSEVRKLLFNGWNTEAIMHATSEIIASDSQSSALQWSFPQAYYSAFSLCRAYFLLAGFTENTHSTVRKRFGMECEAGKYPKSISFAANGPPKDIEFRNIESPKDVGVLEFCPDREETVDNQICQFLRSTRKQALEERKKTTSIRTKAGKPKKSFSRKDWMQVSNNVGPTAMLCLLYRKRLKANYLDIDTFIGGVIDGELVHGSLVDIVHRLNYVHEAFISRMLGADWYAKSVAAFLSKRSFDTLKARAQSVRELTSRDT